MWSALLLCGTLANTVHGSQVEFVTENLVAKALELTAAPLSAGASNIASLAEGSSWPERRNAVASGIVGWAARALSSVGNDSIEGAAPDPKYGYYRWIPQYLGSAIPPTASATTSKKGFKWTNSCYRSNSVSITTVDKTTGAATLTFTFGEKKSLLAQCSDTYVVAGDKVSC
jgi:hypothetical protein